MSCICSRSSGRDRVALVIYEPLIPVRLLMTSARAGR